MLFAVYLVFEFSTLWFREFPPGFHYSGYAHEGAAWLTAALALATLLLSMIFRTEILRDPRLPALRKLGLVWSSLNLVLALAVFNRLFIYIRFNGMTEMRIVGLLGISCVVVGFLMVVSRFMRNRSFAWLISRQLWTASFGCYLLAVIPWEVAIQRYNVAQVIRGNHAPSVQISEHSISQYALPELLPLLQSDDQTIRLGIAAILDERAPVPAVGVEPVEEDGHRTVPSHWTRRQLGNDRANTILTENQSRFRIFSDNVHRAGKRQAFRTYAMQWW
ncbi:MAG: DUF4173 domain-containing protein [Planctomycetaceae bacterium]|nr:DUF4173 domain-containing protein [Planctomycetaceae bacterium]